MSQHAILRFAKHKGGSCRALEAHHERQKEKYASPTFFKGKTLSEVKEFFKTAVDFLSEKIGRQNIF